MRYPNHLFILHLSTSAGTYVKEFVHGDFGRTIPNLSSILFGTSYENDTTTTITSNTLLPRIDILELDCTGIQS